MVQIGGSWILIEDRKRIEIDFNILGIGNPDHLLLYYKAIRCREGFDFAGSQVL
jgi:hypothetical protein